MVRSRGLVLVVEPDVGVAELQRLYLDREGFEVHVATAHAAGLRAARSLEPVVTVADTDAAREPDGGVELYHSLREATGRRPVILVAGRGRPLERLRARGISSRALLAKPFGPRELTARVTEAARHRACGTSIERAHRVGEVVVDLDRREALVEGSRVALTATEFGLLAFLVQRPGRVCTREHLLAAVWGPVPAASARTVDVHIAQLRAKLGAVSPIRTVRGVGYAVQHPS